MVAYGLVVVILREAERVPSAVLLCEPDKQCAYHESIWSVTVSRRRGLDSVLVL